MIHSIHVIENQGIAQPASWHWRKQSDLSAIIQVYGYYEQTRIKMNKDAYRPNVDRKEKDALA